MASAHELLPSTLPVMPRSGTSSSDVGPNPRARTRDTGPDQLQRCVGLRGHEDGRGPSHRRRRSADAAEVLCYARVGRGLPTQEAGLELDDTRAGGGGEVVLGGEA